jgi:hypothetical protein
MFPLGFELAVQASERLQTHALDRAATVIMATKRHKLNLLCVYHSVDFIETKRIPVLNFHIKRNRHKLLDKPVKVMC